MTIALIILLIALVVVYKMRAKLGQPAANGLLGVLVVAGLVLIGLTLKNQFGGGVKIADALHAAPGYMLGREIAAAYPDGGTVIAFDFDPLGTGDRIMDARVAGLTQGLASGNFTVVAEEPALEPEQLGELEDIKLGIEAFLEVGSRHPDAVAMVSFAGLPAARDGTQLKALPPLFAVSLGDPGLTKAYVRNGIVPAAVAYLPDADWSREPAPGDSLEDVGAAFYLLVTKENLDALNL